MHHKTGQMYNGIKKENIVKTWSASYSKDVFFFSALFFFFKLIHWFLRFLNLFLDK